MNDNSTPISKSRDERRVENEYMFNNMNEQYERSVADHMTVEQFEDAPLDFFCECSDPKCLEKINISAKQFNDIHNRSDQFIVCNGHEQLDIEDVIAKEHGYTVVQKHGQIVKELKQDSSTNSD